MSNEKAAADVTEAIHCHVVDWSKAAMTSLQRRRVDKIAVVSLDIILLDHAHFSSSVAQVSTAQFPSLFISLLTFHVFFKFHPFKNMAGHLRYFPPGLLLPSQLQSVTDIWSVPNYTA